MGCRPISRREKQLINAWDWAFCVKIHLVLCDGVVSRCFNTQSGIRLGNGSILSLTQSGQSFPSHENCQPMWTILQTILIVLLGACCRQFSQLLLVNVLLINSLWWILSYFIWLMLGLYLFCLISLFWLILLLAKKGLPLNLEKQFVFSCGSYSTGLCS